jgi:hypothetical protein
MTFMFVQKLELGTKTVALDVKQDEITMII